jgi:hypothetical protein
MIKLPDVTDKELLIIQTALIAFEDMHRYSNSQEALELRYKITDESSKIGD